MHMTITETLKNAIQAATDEFTATSDVDNFTSAIIAAFFDAIAALETSKNGG